MKYLWKTALCSGAIAIAGCTNNPNTSNPSAPTPHTVNKPVMEPSSPPETRTNAPSTENTNGTNVPMNPQTTPSTQNPRTNQ